MCRYAAKGGRGRLTDTAAMLYVEITFMCMLVMGIIIYQLLKSLDRRWDHQVLIDTLTLFVLAYLCDGAWGAMMPRAASMPRWLCWAANYGYFIASSLGCFGWFLYAQAQQEAPMCKSARRIALAFLPMLLLLLMILSSSHTHWIFYLDAQNGYQRGSLHLLHMIVSYGYTVFSSIRALVLALQKRNYARRMELLSLTLFTFVPMPFLIQQQVHGGQVPALCIGTTLATLMLYINQQAGMISIDPLTQLNNRRQMIRFLSGKMKSHNADYRLYLLMMDVDNLKQLNDEFGHVEGDTALCRIADTLKAALPRNFFIGRYGGDEFIAIGEAESEAEVRMVRNTIRATLCQNNCLANAPTQVTLSIGYAVKTPAIQDIPDFIRAADRDLYQEKSQAHKRTPRNNVR